MFSLLKLVHLLGLTAKTSAYNVYRTLERSTNNTGLNTPKSHYRPLLCMAMQWCHLKLLKRGGRAHNDSGVTATKEGKLAVLCPSCPCPGINLPDDWKAVPENKRFLYAALICMDANFRLKNQLVSDYSQDPVLGPGWAYMVQHEPYEENVLKQAEQQDISAAVFLLLLFSHFKFRLVPA
ncbi:unnamed protein product [Cyclocybe aegerita]|uniref:CxC2-like cysteine cluster KDZ transposase-associated domain-containing protein n=1 Tax=Cyclocybe aegerita TaxID=1973307 RepID=A0A8S0WGZ9_CYCAE|nr:unnamed protein product [Cyclocybe aegerita]